MADAFKKVVFLYAPSEDRGLWDGVVEYASVHRRWLLYSPLLLQFEADEEEIYRWLKQVRPDGLIVPNSRENLGKILRLSIPTILHRNVKPRLPGRPAIVGNGERIGKMAAEHFLKLGFKNFGSYICAAHVPMQERAESFAKYLRESGFDIRVLVRPRPGNLTSWNRELLILADWLKSLRKPAAVLAGDDTLAVDVLTACRIADLLVPQQIAVLGVNNNRTICETQIPRISSVALDYRKAGFEAAALLDRMMNKQPLPRDQTVLIEPTAVIPRQSTDFSAIEDYEIAKAMTFIRHHSTGRLQVSDVAAHVHLSINALQKRFKKAVGSSVAREIRRVCADRIADLLIHSDLSIEEIALTVGFSNPSHIARFFQKARGMSPLAFRRQYSPRQER
ncbi:MAG: DNA-binding transcriptional regulator [Anaerohalosphaeraceae bacterium]